MKNPRLLFLLEHLLSVIFLILFLPLEASPKDLPQEPGRGLNLLDAVKMTIAKQPAIHIQEKEVDISKGVLQQAEGRFDPTLNAKASVEDTHTPLLEAERIITGLDNSEQVFTVYQVGINKLLRTGVLLNPNINMIRTDDLSFGTRTISEASVNFTVTFPLLRGRGREATEAEATAATSRFEASELDLRQTISQSVLDTSVAYWNYVAADKNLIILKETETRANQLVKDVEELVAADERPPSDLNQLRANLSAKTDDRIRNEQNLYEAQQALGIAMGLPLNEIKTLPLPVESFPKSVPENSLLTDHDQTWYIELSRNNRADLMALKKREDSAEILLKSAVINKKPQLDFSVNLGYSGLAEGQSERHFYDAFYHQASGLNFLAVLSYQYPVGNNTAMGLLNQRKAVYDQALMQTAELERHICSNVAIAMQALIMSLRELGEVRKSVSYYQKAVDDEKMKLALGMSTVIDVVILEDQLRDALLRQVSAQKNYSTALVGLRFTTGTLISLGQGNEYAVTMKNLTSIPSINAKP